MTAPNLRMHVQDTVDVDSRPQAHPAQDISGYAIFSAGELGSAHAMAHEMLDNGRIRSGYRRLGGWLAEHTGSGSEWVHLHFHMAIFELALGDWDAAYARFLSEVLPAAATGEALTDAPGLLWRLAISAPAPVALPWKPLRRTALAHMARVRDPFVQLHNLLALAGARDADGIEGWLQARPEAQRQERAAALERAAKALKWLAAGSFHRAGAQMQKVLSGITAVGGSHAQNQLFGQLARWCVRQAIEVGNGRLYANAA